MCSENLNGVFINAIVFFLIIKKERRLGGRMSINSIPQFSMAFEIDEYDKIRIYVIEFILFSYLISQYYYLIAPLSVLLPVYFYSETKITNGIKNILDSATFFAAPPTYLSLLGISLFLLSIANSIFLYSIYSKLEFSFLSYYFYCLLISSAIFLCSLSFKCFSLVFGLVNFNMIRRGFFGISQRLVIIFRFIILIPFGSSYIQQFVSIGIQNSTQKLNFLLSISEIFSANNNILMIYLLMKAIGIIWLLLDLAFTIRFYNFNKHKVLVPAKPNPDSTDLCVICRESPENPHSLPCGHVFCFKCITRWIQEHNTCPLCMTEFVTFKSIDFTLGDLPQSIFLLAF